MPRNPRTSSGRLVLLGLSVGGDVDIARGHVSANRGSTLNQPLRPAAPRTHFWQRQGENRAIGSPEILVMAIRLLRRIPGVPGQNFAHSPGTTATLMMTSRRPNEPRRECAARARIGASDSSGCRGFARDRRLAGSAARRNRCARPKGSPPRWAEGRRTGAPVGGRRGGVRRQCAPTRHQSTPPKVAGPRSGARPVALRVADGSGPGAWRGRDARRSGDGGANPTR
jgi:hypothetical protein